MRGALILAVVLAGALADATAQPQGADQGYEERIREEERELERLRKELGRYREEARTLSVKEKGVQGELQRLDRKIDLTERLLRGLGRDIARLRGELAGLEEGLADTEVRLGARRSLLLRRLRGMYKRGRLHGLEVLLSAGSFPDFLRRVRYLEVVAREDRRLVAEISGMREAVLRDKQAREEKLDQVAAREREARLEDRALARDRKEKQKLLASVKGERKKREEAIAELQEQTRQLEALIERLEKERLAALARKEPVYEGDHALQKAFGKLPWPVRGRVVTRFGPTNHPIYKTRVISNGIDIAAAVGTPVRAVSRGKVEFADWWQAYGKLIILNHGDGYYSLYGHLRDVSARAGEEVQRGQAIGTVGTTGSLEGPTLHFELRRGRVAVDPLAWLGAP